ncbi:MAG: transglycosylase SLT domain-containing protein [Nitrospira sp.]|nr:transglycosylase SLT domain-containing protein [bacterium]MBL7048273.1 transglycosylase SLT domain-containing protein [Nitrospira sp.]
MKNKSVFFSYSGIAVLLIFALSIYWREQSLETSYVEKILPSSRAVDENFPYLMPYTAVESSPPAMSGFVGDSVLAVRNNDRLSFWDHSGWSGRVVREIWEYNVAGSDNSAVDVLFSNLGYNRHVKQRLQYYTKRQQHMMRVRIGRSGKYVSVMAEIMADRGLPGELVFLPIIESGFDPYAYSQSRAAGLWQFMPATARRFGLKIDWWVDERRDPIKATLAAAEYLDLLYNRFGTWNLALAAYNAGEGRVSRALSQLSNKNFWALRQTGHIRNETKNYVPSFIAATAIALHPERFGIDNIQYHAPISYDEVIVNEPLALEAVAYFTGVSLQEIRDLNPELRRGNTPPNVLCYILKIPMGSKTDFLVNLERARLKKSALVKYYEVQSGDTLFKIAGKTGTSAQLIADLNFLGQESIIIAGKRILLPLHDVRSLMF